jgi:hypothetical protein
MRGESVDFHRLLAAAPWPLRFSYGAPKLGHFFAATQLLLKSLDLLVVETTSNDFVGMRWRGEKLFRPWHPLQKVKIEPGSHSQPKPSELFGILNY